MRRDALLLLLFVSLPAAGQGIDWSQPPPLAAEKVFHPPRAVRLALAGGGTLLVIENHDLPLVTAVFVVPGAGSAADPRGQEGLAGFTADLLDEGAGGLAARKMAETIEIMGTDLETWAEEDAAYVRVSALAQRFPESLELAAKALTAPAFDDGEAARLHEDRMTEIRLRRDRPGAVAHLVLERALHGAGAPYGHSALGSAAGLGRVDIAEARAFYARHYGAAHLIAVVSGDIGVPEARALVDGALGDWQGAAGPPAVAASAAPHARRAGVLVIDRPAAEQGNVLIGGLALRRGDPGVYALEVLTNLLGGTFTSRLSHRLREELGYTYGISAYATYLRDAGRLSIESAIFTPQTVAGLREIFKILAATARGPVPAAELDASKLNLVRSLPQYFSSNKEIADAFAGLALIGLPDDWFDGYAANIESVTATAVQALAARVLAPRALVTVVVGPLVKIGAGLAKLGRGPIVRFDPDGEELRR